MCILCDRLKTVNTKNPIGIRCYWTDANSTGAITSDLTKCKIEIPHPCGDGSVIVEDWKCCPVCGEPLKVEPCTTYEDVTKREG